jgi:hypothetical protein
MGAEPFLRAQTSGPLGVADATARSLVNAATRSPRSLAPTATFVTSVRHAYERLPAGTRAAAVTAAFAWAKTYVNSAAFASVYAAARQQARPAGVSIGPSVQEELQKKIDDERASLAESKKFLSVVPEADRPSVLQALTEAEARLRDPALIKAWRDDIQSRHDAEETGTAEALASWAALYPANLTIFVRQELQRFLDGSATVDFAIPITPIKNGGQIVGFVGPLEQPPASWIEAECMLAGRDMVMAARAAAQQWVKELSK